MNASARINLQDPVNWTHPLNRGRLVWYYHPKDSGWIPASQGSTVNPGYAYRDLCNRIHGTITGGPSLTPATAFMPNGDACLQWLGGGSTDGQVDLGNSTLFDLTDNFTVGCTFVTDTLSPAGLNSLAGLVNKYNSSLADSWWLRQFNGLIEFGGATGIQTGNVLLTNTVYRCIAVMNNGTATIYLNGVSAATGAVSITSSPSNNVYIGESYEPIGANFRGRISDVFIATRPWSSSEVQLDAKLSQIGYRAENSPLRFVESFRKYTADQSTIVSFTTSVGVSDALRFSSPAYFTTTLRPSVAAGGIGPVVPSGPADFETVVEASEQFVAGQPTLVNFNTNVGVSTLVDGGSPVEFETVVGVDHSLRTIAAGDRRRLADRRYRR